MLEEKSKVFERYIGILVTIVFKQSNFVLTGKITAVFEDCFEFKTSTKSSIIDYDMIGSIREA